MPKLVVHGRVGLDVVAFKCSECDQVFPLSGDQIPAADKERLLTRQFEQHIATAHKKLGHEDANHSAFRVVR